MSSFTNTYYYSLDPKGRLMIPATLREIINSKYNHTKLYITNAPLDKCLHLYPVAEWNLVEERLRDKPKTDKTIQFYMRRVFASAVECDMDKQGRVMIPYELRANASLGNDIVLVGLGEKIEIWDKARWDDVIDIDKIDAEAYARKLAEYGL
ncbi:MAG: division/cell wall cluster transcriptional repressor MraZ [Nitrospirae bacterium]|nr:division/cell wall cluster transcriptional repressor MraZ [Nitrospirota bacterium]